MLLDLPPQLILPEHYEARRPAIIRPEVDPRRYFPVELTRAEQRAIHAELRRTGRLDKAMLPGMAPIIAGGLPPVAVTFLSAICTNGSTTTRSWTGVTLGAAYTHFVVAAGWASGDGANRTATGLTVATAPATRIAQSNTAYTGAAIYIIELTAASGTISLTTSGATVSGQSYAVWGLTNLLSMTPVDIDEQNDGSSDNPIPCTLNPTASGGAAFAAATIWGNVTSANLNWSGDISGRDFDTNDGSIGRSGKAIPTSGDPLSFSSPDPSASIATSNAVAVALR